MTEATKERRPGLAEQAYEALANLTYQAAILVWLGTALLPGGIVAGQSWSWLKFGYWSPIPFSTVFAKLQVAEPTADWVGVQQMIDWALARPASLVLLILGTAVAASLHMLSLRVQEMWSDEASKSRAASV